MPIYNSIRVQHWHKLENILFPQDRGSGIVLLEKEPDQPVHHVRRTGFSGMHPCAYKHGLFARESVGPVVGLLGEKVCQRLLPLLGDPAQVGDGEQVQPSLLQAPNNVFPVKVDGRLR